MEPGENCAAISISFNEVDPRSSFQTLHARTNSELDSFINYYFSKSKNRKNASIIIRIIAVAAGIFAALALNPLPLQMLPSAAM